MIAPELPPATRRLRARDCSPPRGFTLLELLVVVTVVGIVAGFAYPRLDAVRYRLNGDVRVVAASLAYAQRLAVTLQHDVLVSVDAGTRQLRVHEDRNNDGLYTSDEGVRVVTLSPGINFTWTGTPDLPFPASSVELTEMIFRRDGSASAAGAIYLNTDRAVASGSATEARAVEIVRATGRPTWYTFAGGAWRLGGG